ncbi:MAG: aldo/keto reductase [Treponema sp.]|nr:aldo/keto reductase [Treponema sp.]
MIYKEYGQTGKKVSLLGFGGMRFKNIDDHDECVNLMVTAAKGGINYFDTAPGYFGIESEIVFGKAFTQMRKLGLPYFSATKTFKSTESEVRSDIEAQLKRLNIESIDFYHIWCVNSLENWENRKKDGIIQTFQKLKEEGLIKHICISSHLTKNDIKELLMEDVFEGVLFGYSAINFNARQEAFDAIKEKKLGAVVMNPLSGGVIPAHPELFGFIQRDGESVTTSALSFLWDHPEITNTLVGFETLEQLNEVLDAMKNYKPRTKEELEKAKVMAGASFEGICTFCGYCVADNGSGNMCHEGVPIPLFMDAYNQKLLSKESKDPIGDRLKWHWNIDKSLAAKCTSCRLCEKACTQHIDIVKRLKEIT